MPWASARAEFWQQPSTYVLRNQDQSVYLIWIRVFRCKRRPALVWYLGPIELHRKSHKRDSADGFMIGQIIVFIILTNEYTKLPAFHAYGSNSTESKYFFSQYIFQYIIRIKHFLQCTIPEEARQSENDDRQDLGTICCQAKTSQRKG